MCGVLFTNDTSVCKERFVEALQLLNHRGPDAEGYASLGPVKLGHKRLKILDLDNRSNQPFYSADGRFALIYNGEIYNYVELAKKYGVVQHTTSDTEVIVELYARHGPKFLDWLNGMFTIIIVDTRSWEVFAARDRLGVKPLYMHRCGKTLTMGSEISAVLKVTGITKFDEIGLRQYRKLRTFFNGRTAYADIEMFPAAHYLESGQLHRYWQLPEGPQKPPEDEELRGLIADSVQQRLVSDVSVGSYLSGGLDSTIVSALARTPHTWTVGFENNNEFKWGRLAAEHIHSTHHEVLMEREEFVAIAKDMIKKRREPLSVPNEVLLYKMTSKVKEHNTVVLSGEGADELFFGYDRIFRWAAQAEKWDLSEFSRLYAYGAHEDMEIMEDAVAPFTHLNDALAIVAHFFQIAHLHGLLRRLDNSTMLCAVEARVPFVDYHPLIERMAGVSFAYRMAAGVVKSPLKRIFREILPASIIERKKVGFPVPLETLALNVDPSLDPMDRWLEFNLAQFAPEHAARIINN